jgi:Bacterial Ig-like domain
VPAEVIDAAGTPRIDTAGMAGRFEFSGGALHFMPRFPFAPGVGYSLIDRQAVGARSVPTLRRPAPPAAPSTRVIEIYPTAPAVPFNLLRFYVHFSAPMSEGFAPQAARVTDAVTGAPVTDALLPMEPELWDRRRTRLTLLLDPGRIKRGLVPHTETGYPLAEGMHLAISIDDTFLDADATPLAATGHRDYLVVDAERRHVQPADWTYQWPRADTREPVTITFDRPLDHALALRCLHISDASGTTVDGNASLEQGETRWHFDPAENWQPATYTLTIEPILEDLAGNSITRVFDRDLTRPTDDPVEALPVTIPFACT